MSSDNDIVWLNGLKTPSKNQYFITGSQITVQLTQQKTMIIDADDLGILKLHVFCVQKDKNTFYADTRINTKSGRKTVSFHRILCKKVFDMADDLVVDHLNHDGLDNRRINLVPKTMSGNQRNRQINKNNTTGVLGVTIEYNRGVKQYRAYIHENEKQMAKTFSVKKYGDEKAFAIACAWRKSQAERLGYVINN